MNRVPMPEEMAACRPFLNSELKGRKVVVGLGKSAVKDLLGYEGPMAKKAWFNNREEGECSVEIELQQAILFIHDRIEKDAWLEEYFPKQMEVYHQAIEQTREQILGQLNVTL